MLRFCLKSFMLGTGVALALSFTPLLFGPRAWHLFPFALLIWPTGILLASEFLGLLSPTALAILVGVSAVGNGLVYTFIGMLLYVATKHI